MGAERVVRASAPVRVCDNGGWTDTWFAGHGCVLNVAVRPGVEVAVMAQTGAGRIVLDVTDYGERYTVDGRRRHPLLEACLDEIRPPADLDLEVHVHSDVPPGCGTGTSAAVLVALLAALDGLRGGSMKPDELARAAHRVETERAGLQSGIQDQLAAAHGGVLFIEMTAYPEAHVTRLSLSDEVRAQLDERLVLVYLGRAHASSAVHDEVISLLEREGERSGHLEELRQAATAARDAIEAEDLDAFGGALARNTDAQARLHPSLVSDGARTLIGLAREHGALGWKVNGAGGDGGSVSILCRDHGREFSRAVPRALPEARVIPVAFSADGVRVSP